MNFAQFATPAVLLLILAASGMLIFQDWRLVVASFALQYLGVVILVGNSWPLSLAVIKLVVGWMAAIALGTTQVGQNLPAEQRGISAHRVLRLLAVGLVTILCYSISSSVIWVISSLNLRARGSLLPCRAGVSALTV